MKPDLQNKWMEAELGSLEGLPAEPQAAPPPAKKVGARLASAWDVLYVLLRVVVALLVAYHGGQKLIGIFSDEPVRQDHMTLLLGAIEFLGGVVLALGVYTRPIALGMLIEMGWVYYKMCPMGTLTPIPTGGEMPLLFCVFFLVLLLFGPGNISIDKIHHRG
jgi:putative oxidoreductase